jgi:signal peptidase II
MDATKARPGGALGLALGLAAVVLVLDQASKWVILTQVMQPPRVVEVTGFFNLVLTYNTGISFGWLGGEAVAWKSWALGGLALAVSAGLLYWLARQPERILSLAVGLIVGGALGNALDRAYRPGVVDFLDFHLFGWHWPAFNLADSSIFLGVVILVLDGLFRAPVRSNNTDNQKKNGIVRED